MNTKSRLSMAALLLILASGPAYPQNREILELNRDVLDVRERIKQLQTSVDSNNAFMKSLIEKMADQVSTLSTGMQKVNQAVDSLKNQNDTVTRDLRASLKTLSDSVKEMQGDLSSARGQISSVSREITTLKTTAEPLPGADDLWRSAYTNFSAGIYNLAMADVQDFLSKYPNDPRAVEAELLMGDALMAQKKFDAAITQYDIVLQKYPESDKSRTALLKKGLAQAESNLPQANSTLSEVVKKFPGTSEAVSAQTKLKEMQSAQRGRTPARPGPGQ